jgi:hypothetical protein
VTEEVSPERKGARAGAKLAMTTQSDHVFSGVAFT